MDSRGFFNQVWIWKKTWLSTNTTNCPVFPLSLRVLHAKLWLWTSKIFRDGPHTYTLHLLYGHNGELMDNLFKWSTRTMEFAHSNFRVTRFIQLSPTGFCNLDLLRPFLYESITGKTVHTNEQSGHTLKTILLILLYGILGRLNALEISILEVSAAPSNFLGPLNLKKKQGQLLG